MRFVWVSASYQHCGHGKDDGDAEDHLPQRPLARTRHIGVQVEAPDGKAQVEQRRDGDEGDGAVLVLVDRLAQGDVLARRVVGHPFALGWHVVRGVLYR